MSRKRLPINLRARRLIFIPCLIGGLLLAACDLPVPQQELPPLKEPYLEFEYEVIPFSFAAVRRIKSELMELRQSGFISEEGSSSPDSCSYQASFNPHPRQQSGDYLPSEMTRAPYVEAFGNPESLGFRLMLEASNARNLKPLCGWQSQTVQGLQLVSGEGPAKTWLQGSEIQVITRPRMNARSLKNPRVFTALHEGTRLFFEYIVDDVDPRGYVEGRFMFLVANPDSPILIHTRSGRFGLYKQNESVERYR